MNRSYQSNSDSWFGKTLAMHNNEINEAFLREYCQHLEQKPVFDSTGWGWLGIFAQQQPVELRDEFQARANDQVSKPYACTMCHDNPATKYHICIGMVCDGCYLTLPKE